MKSVGEVSWVKGLTRYIYIFIYVCICIYINKLWVGEVSWNPLGAMQIGPLYIYIYIYNIYIYIYIYI